MDRSGLAFFAPRDAAELAAALAWAEYAADWRGRARAGRRPRRLHAVRDGAATLHTVVRMTLSPAGELRCRLFDWGTRRLSGDRRVRDSLASLAAEARELAATERAAQLADARALLG